MKAFFCFIVLILGFCSAEEKSNNPGVAQPRKTNDSPTNTATHHGQETKPEGSVIPSQLNHSTADITNVTLSKSTENVLNESLATSSSTPVPPSPVPPPPTYGVGEWNVTDENGTVCILLTGDLALNLVNETDNKTFQTFRVPSNVPHHGNCVEQCIEFDMPNNCSLHLMFGKNTTSDKFYLRAIKGIVHYSATANKSQTSLNFLNDSLHLFENPLENSYHCAPASENTIYQIPLLHVTLKVEEFQVQAFRNSTKGEFSDPVDCQAPHTPDIVPIIVGCALALLVVLVLVAYLVSRSRSQSRGYYSM